MLDGTQKFMGTSMEVTVYGVRNKECERVLRFCASMNMTVGNTLLKK